MRALLALLLLANLVFLALSRGWLEPHAGLSALHQREPQRLAAQIDPRSVRVLDPAAAAAALAQRGPPATPASAAAAASAAAVSARDSRLAGEAEFSASAAAAARPAATAPR